MVSYNKQTLDTPNPIARYAHRNRLSRSISIINSQANIHKVLDYGCGSGAFIKTIHETNGIEAFGYEPFMKERINAEIPIFTDFPTAEDAGPFDIITIFETIEHLSDLELHKFLTRSDKLLTEKGKILASVPIEIGPALLMKEINRCILHKRLPKISLFELFRASFLGIATRRAKNIKNSHEGFDFRLAIHFIENQFGPVTIESYGPLPIGTWYGNSQVYFWISRHPI